MKKIAFCFLVTDGVQVPEIWKSWFSGYESYFSIYAHFKITDEKNLAAGDQKWLWSKKIPSIRTEWGTISLVKAEMLLYRAALQDLSNEVMVLLSGSDVPLFAFDKTYNWLMEPHPETKRVMSWIRFFEPEDHVVPLLPKHKFWHASQWKSVNRYIAFLLSKMPEEYLQEWDKLFPLKERKEADFLAPDEIVPFHYLVSVLGTPDSKTFQQDIENRAVTYVDFPKMNALHPIVWKDLSASLIKDLCRWKIPFLRKVESNFKATLPIVCPKYATMRTKINK